MTSSPVSCLRSDLGVRLRTFGETSDVRRDFGRSARLRRELSRTLSRADGEPVEPPRELLSNAELTAEAYTLHPRKTFSADPK